jgi:hypothetical protein
MKAVLAATLSILICLAGRQAHAELTPAQFVELAETYQAGYLQLLGASALQIYSTAGLIGTDFSRGLMDGPEAADALADTALLHGVSYATLLEVQQRTPKEDAAAHGEIGKLAAVLVEEQVLLLALQDVFSNPTDGNAKRVDTAKKNVGGMLEDLLGE